MQPEVIHTPERSSCGLSNVAVSLSVLYLDDDDIDRMLMQMHVKRHTNGTVDLRLVDTICGARDALATEHFDYLVIDNRIPPVQDYRETLDLLGVGDFDGRIIVVSSETQFESFNSDRDPRVHSITDKSDLSKAIRNGLFEPFRMN